MLDPLDESGDGNSYAIQGLYIQPTLLATGRLHDDGTIQSKVGIIAKTTTAW